MSFIWSAETLARINDPNDPLTHGEAAFLTDSLEEKFSEFARGYIINGEEQSIRSLVAYGADLNCIIMKPGGEETDILESFLDQASTPHQATKLYFELGGNPPSGFYHLSTLLTHAYLPKEEMLQTFRLMMENGLGHVVPMVDSAADAREAADGDSFYSPYGKGAVRVLHRDKSEVFYLRNKASQARSHANDILRENAPGLSMLLGDVDIVKEYKEKVDAAKNTLLKEGAEALPSDGLTNLYIGLWHTEKEIQQALLRSPAILPSLIEQQPPMIKKAYMHMIPEITAGVASSVVEGPAKDWSAVHALSQGKAV